MDSDTAQDLTRQQRRQDRWRAAAKALGEICVEQRTAGLDKTAELDDEGREALIEAADAYGQARSELNAHARQHVDTIFAAAAERKAAAERQAAEAKAAAETATPAAEEAPEEARPAEAAASAEEAPAEEPAAAEAASDPSAEPAAEAVPAAEAPAKPKAKPPAKKA